MSKRDPDIALRQILVYSREAVEICHGKSRPDLDILWAIMSNDLPVLILQLENILEVEP
jgi:uncharacterized protein with HEPN domain